MESFIPHPLFAGIAFLLTGLALGAGTCGGLVRYWPKTARGWDAGDLVRKSQKTPVMRLGGIGVAVALLVIIPVASLLLEPAATRVGDPWSLLFVCLLFFAIGVVDDLMPVPATGKLLLQFGAALIAFGLGFQIELITEPFGGNSMAVGGFALPITVFWLIAIPNLINLVDGIDGVAGGVGISLAGTLAVVAWMGGDWLLFAICLGMIGSLIGFLFFNLPSARVYLGDGGAYLVGAFVALSSIQASQKGAVAGALFVIVLALALPIADTVFAILRRSFYGFPIWKADSEHIHHRLVTLGVRKGLVIGGMIATVTIFSLMGLSLVAEDGQTWPVVLTICVASVLLLIRLLGYWGSFGAFVNHMRRVLMTREKVRYAYALGCVLEHEIDRTSEKDEFWSDFSRSLKKVGLFPISSNHPCPDDMVAMRIPLASGEEWLLAHRPGTRDMHWGKVAACFLGPLSRAMHKWGQIPPQLGVKGAAERLDLLSEREPNEVPVPLKQVIRIIKKQKIGEFGKK